MERCNMFKHIFVNGFESPGVANGLSRATDNGTVRTCNMLCFPCLHKYANMYMRFERSSLKTNRLYVCKQIQGQSMELVVTMVVMCGQWAVGPGAVESQLIGPVRNGNWGPPGPEECFFQSRRGS